jgi:23S rRNA (guanosine2251-2'-O)-methyltransferase
MRNNHFPGKPSKGPGPGRVPPVDRRQTAANHPDANTTSKGIEPTPKPTIGRAHMLYGTHPVAMAWLNPERVCRRLYATAQTAAAFIGTIDRAVTLGLRRPAPLIVDRDAIERLLPPGSVHQGVALHAEPLPEIGLEDVLITIGDGAATLLLLDQVTDPHNVGAILRSAAALGVSGMIVQSRHAPDITGVLAKAASGAVEIVPILRETNLSRSIERLRDAGFFVVGLAEAASVGIGDAAFPPKTVLALGAEGEGLRRLVAEKCDLLASLPTQPPIVSLNVSNAAAIGLYEIARRQPRRTLKK